MITLVTVIAIVGFLSYANGANDNFKGVATLLGSGTIDYKTARWVSTLTTALGSVCALVLAQGLIAKFSGKGLVPDEVMTLKSFCLSVGMASAMTVMLATKFGFPISTTHALTGALVGAGVFASSSGVNLSKLGGSFFLPLLVSPVLAATMAMAFYPLFRVARRRLKVEKETCVCVGRKIIGIAPKHLTPEGAISFYSAELALPSVSTGTRATCEVRYQGQLAGISASRLVDFLHYLSAGTVCFARGLNDTPKIAALLLVGAALPISISLLLVGVFMAAGGYWSGRKVAETMSRKITEMNPGQGFAGNLTTGILVVFASKWGLPVSTTHVSCGALFGIGSVTGQANWKTILTILTAWVTTLPVAASLGVLCFAAFRHLPL